MNKLFYAVESRNGYSYIDEFSNANGDKFSGCTRTVECFPTKKLAASVCRELNALASQVNELNRVLEPPAGYESFYNDLPETLKKQSN